MRICLGATRRDCIQDDTGAVTVAAALWLPFFVILFAMIADASFIFYGQARVLQVAEDANRSLSVGTYTTAAETQTAIEKTLEKISPNAKATTQLADYLITTVVTIPASDLAKVGFIPSMTSFRMTVVANMVKEF